MTLVHDIGYRRAKWFQWYPQIDLHEIISLVGKLDDGETVVPGYSLEISDDWVQKGYELKLSRFKDNMYRNTAWRLYPVLVPWSLVALVILASFLVHAHRAGQPVPYFVYLYLPVAAFMIILFARERGQNADHWFFRSVRKIESIARLRRGVYQSESLIECVNRGGIASRHLFRMLQHRRRSWTAPPSISDRALTLCFPLINVDIESSRVSHLGFELALDRYADFMHQVSVLVVAGREDLIPRLREEYADIGLPKSSDLAKRVPPKDAEFIDPMRKHNRWSVISHYVYPLGPWLSFLVALAALVFSLYR